MVDINKMGIYLVTDSDILKGRDFYEAIEDSLKAGVKVIQLREKALDGREFLERAKKIRAMTREYDAMFIVNDRIDVAILSEADGIHIGQSDIDIKDARKLVGNKIIGVSASNLEEAKLAQENGADYIGVGAIFSTDTKKDAKNVGLRNLEIIRSEVSTPIVVIGGINLENIVEIKRIEVEGYAVISDILKYKDIEDRCKQFINLIK